LAATEVRNFMALSLAKAAHVKIEMVLPQCWLEQQGMACGGNDEFSLSAR
jgi:hypothetical protein